MATMTPTLLNYKMVTILCSEFKIKYPSPKKEWPRVRHYENIDACFKENDAGGPIFHSLPSTLGQPSVMCNFIGLKKYVLEAQIRVYNTFSQRNNVKL